MHKSTLNRLIYPCGQKGKHLEIVTSKLAATWLRQGGFAWRDTNTQSTHIDAKQEPHSNEQVGSNYESNNQGSRKHRKALARAKFCPMWSDDDVGESNRGPIGINRIY
jgi:hypothetical protein